MSRYVAALVYRKRLGSMARKSILCYCAERANDDGTGVWASKVRIAKEVECSKPTVIDTLRAFVNEGILIEAGRRPCQNGYVIEYDISIAAVEALPDAISPEETTGQIFDRSSQLTPRGKATLPQEVKPLDSNRPRTVHKPSGDLFGQKVKVEESPDEIAEHFSAFWDHWPSGPRKTAKKKCEAVYRSACLGTHKNADKVSPADLNRCARLYVEDLKRRNALEYIKGPLPWLNLPGWEPFLEQQKPGRHGVAPDLERYL